MTIESLGVRKEGNRLRGFLAHAAGIVHRASPLQKSVNADTAGKAGRRARRKAVARAGEVVARDGVRRRGILRRLGRAEAAEPRARGRPQPGQGSLF